MKKIKANSKNLNFTKLAHSGISLIVLVITIIVIIILAAAIIISLNNNNPIMEANTARYESDRANMQAIFTNAVSKVMAKNQATINVSPGQINTITGGQKEVLGEVAYTLTDAQNSNYSTGKIVFDNKTSMDDTIFYTGKKLPIYAAGETKWYVDAEGNISLEVAGTKYGSGEIAKPKLTLITGSEFNSIIPDEIRIIKFVNTAATTEIETIDVSQAQDGSILAWSEDTTFYVAPKNAGDIICANPDSSYMFCCGEAWDSLMVDRYLQAAYFDNFDTSYVTNMRNMFYAFGAEQSDVEIVGVSNWDVSNVTNMSGLFECFGYDSTDCEFKIDLSNWNVSNVVDMRGIFYCAVSDGPVFNLGNLSKWDVSNVTDMGYMFGGAGSDATDWYIGDISEWNISNVTDMSYMLSSALGKSNVWCIGDLSKWGKNTSKVTSMNYMLSSVGKNVEIFDMDLSSWDVSNVTNMDGMFRETGINSSSYNLNLSGWNVSNVTNMSQMFYHVAENSSAFSLNLAGFDTSSVTNMNWMFENAGKNADYTLDLSSWNVPKVKNKLNFDKGVETKIVSPWD